MNIRNFMIITLVCLLLTGISVTSAQQAKALGAGSRTITLIVKSSPDAAYASKMKIKSPRLLRELSDPDYRRSADIVPVTDSYLTIGRKSDISLFAVDREGNVFVLKKGTSVMLSPKAKKELLSSMTKLRNKHYGKLLPWEQAERYVPRKSIFTVVDLESGMSFRVQRRAGSNHADVQPITKADTYKMKTVYNGKWSWKRRAILVNSDKHTIAASMHGMPHGGDGIPGNDFSGHFCIHFKGSATHGSKTVDPSHQLMIYKASGKWNEYFDQADSKEVVEAFLVALKQQDPQLLRNTLDNKTSTKKLVDFYIQEIDQISAIQIRNDIRIVKSGLTESELTAAVAVYKAGQGTESVSYTFIVKKASEKSPWKIEHITMVS